MTIFDRDQRSQIFQISDTSRRNLCRGIGAIIEMELLIHNAADQAYVINNGRDLNGEVFDTYHFQMAPNQRFATEPAAVLGTCFKVGENLVMTAAHLVFREDGHIMDFSKKRIIFQWYYDQAAPGSDEPPDINLVSEYQVYEIAELLKFRYDDENNGSPMEKADWAILRTSRPIGNSSSVGTNNTIPTLTIGGESAVGDEIWTAGHGMGIPMKYSPGFKKSFVNHAGTFSCDLDTFIGNSGSPVFNTAGKVIGVLNKGPQDDWQKVGNAMEAKIFPASNLAACIDVSGTSELDPIMNSTFVVILLNIVLTGPSALISAELIVDPFDCQDKDLHARPMINPVTVIANGPGPSSVSIPIQIKAGSVPLNRHLVMRVDGISGNTTIDIGHVEMMIGADVSLKLGHEQPIRTLNQYDCQYYISNSVGS